MNTPEQRNDAIAELRAALQELESGGALTRLVAGHGLMSRTFEFKWNEPELGISIRLPYARVLLEEKMQAADSAEIGAAMRMSILLLETAARGALLQDGESRLDVSLVDGVARYRVLGRDGVSIDGASDWDGLVARMKPAFTGEGEGVSIFLP